MSPHPHNGMAMMASGVLSVFGSSHFRVMCGQSSCKSRVGTPQQWVDLIPSTISSETWVVSPFGCSDSSESNNLMSPIAVTSVGNYQRTSTSLTRCSSVVFAFQ